MLLCVAFSCLVVQMKGAAIRLYIAELQSCGEVLVAAFSALVLPLGPNYCTHTTLVATRQEAIERALSMS